MNGTGTKAVAPARALLVWIPPFYVSFLSFHLVEVMKLAFNPKWDPQQWMSGLHTWMECLGVPCVHTAELRASTDDRLLRNLFPCSSGNVQTAVRTRVRWTGSDSEQIKCVYSCGNKAAHVMAKLNVFYWLINHCGQTFAQGYKKAKKQILDIGRTEGQVFTEHLEDSCGVRRAREGAFRQMSKVLSWGVNMVCLGLFPLKKVPILWL